MLFTAIYLLASQRRVAPRYRNAVVISAIVCGIAAYHYFRIFANFQESYPPVRRFRASALLGPWGQTPAGPDHFPAGGVFALGVRP